MVSLIGVGDNTFDRYLDRGLMYPGGNAVNVPVLIKRLGGDSAYLGWVGDDRRGMLLLDALKSEDVDVSRCRVIPHPTGYCDIELHDGDRQFKGSIPGARKHIKLEEPDYDYISRFDITHTSIYSFIEPQLAELKKASKSLSFDFSSDWTKEYLEETLPQIDTAFLSAPTLSEREVEKMVKWIHKKTDGLVVITRGSRGSTGFDGDKIHHQVIVEIDPVDTLGAGDSYIARLLHETCKGTPLEDAMRLASESGAETCGYFGAWGHEAPIDES